MMRNPLFTGDFSASVQGYKADKSWHAKKGQDMIINILEYLEQAPAQS